ncbi:MAG TPA: prephenate dehydratase [Polyangiaceae bacterium]|nr:prephenate dehydratase [Polyangiaceae bacterium]
MPTSPNKPRIAFLGPLGTFSYEAVIAHFGGDVEPVASPSIPAVFENVARGDADQGVVPIENSIEGGVNFTQDTLLETQLSLCGEIMVDVEQCLLSNAVERSRIERVYSHPQGLAQCRKWLARNLPNATLVPTASTVQAAHLVAGDATAAAVASRLAARLAGVTVVEGAIQDQASNVTRFVVLGSAEQRTRPTGNDKTSLVFSTRDERGALVRALTLFDRAGINLCRIESRPRTGEAWQYVFFVDLEGHLDDDNVREALRALQGHAELEGQSDMVKVFGSYPRARAK